MSSQGGTLTRPLTGPCMRSGKSIKPHEGGLVQMIEIETGKVRASTYVCGKHSKKVMKGLYQIYASDGKAQAKAAPDLPNAAWEGRLLSPDDLKKWRTEAGLGSLP